MIEPLLSPPAEAATVPRHVAIIMDGNRRWARAHGLPTIEGHRRGAAALRKICFAARDAGVEILTVYAFSRENWARPEFEVGLLLDLCRFMARREFAALDREGVRVRVIGDTAALPAATRAALADLVGGTDRNAGLVLNLAINYSGRSELCEAARTLARDVADGRVPLDRIDETLFASYLSTGGSPDPELLIRTAGDLRLSNFLLYQLAYTEIWSTNVLWPDFTPEAFKGALDEFAERTRRFGR